MTSLAKGIYTLPPSIFKTDLFLIARISDTQWRTETLGAQEQNALGTLREWQP